MKLSKREKVLIYLLIWIGLLVGGVSYVLIPQFNERASLKDSYSEANTKKIEMKSTIDSKDEVETQKVEYIEKAKEMTKYFQPNSVNEDMDRLITGLALSSGLTPSQLDIGNDLSKSSDVSTDSTSEGADSAASSDENTQTSLVDESQVLIIVPLKITATGDFINVKNFLTAISEEDSLELVDFNMTSNISSSSGATGESDSVSSLTTSDDQGSGNVAQGDYSISATVNLYELAK